MKLSIYLLVIVLLAIFLAYFAWFFTVGSTGPAVDSTVPALPTATALPTSVVTPFVPRTPLPSPSSLPSSVLYQVPFMAQAPLNEWDIQLFQDGCEEASLALAYRFVVGSFEASPEDIRAEIVAMSKFQDETYGVAHDRSAWDTARLYEDYYDAGSAQVAYDVSLEDMKRALANGSVLVVPMNGRTLANPFYNAPGPDRHMVVVIGYDQERNEFIVHDVGTRQGASWRYDMNHFLESMRDYPTGTYAPIVQERRAMVVVSR